MGTSRELFDIWVDIKYRRWRRVKRSINLLFGSNTYDRSLVIKDSFVTPFNQIIGCRLFGHNWCTKEEIDKYDLDTYLCWKCLKRESKSIRKENDREEKINKILK